jgi:DNA-binding GntR family transcriptional regulator
MLQLAAMKRATVASATGEATSILVDALGRGEFRPGTRLTEESVASQLGISRIPVREALSALVARTLLERRGRGVFVPRLNYSDLEQIYMAREALEGILYRRAAASMTEQSVRVITRLQEGIEKAAKTLAIDQMAESNRAFHFEIMSHAELPLVGNILSNLWDRTSYYRAFFQVDPQHRENTNNEHRQIIEACKNRDANALVSLHIQHRHWLLDRDLPWLNQDEESGDDEEAPRQPVGRRS